MTLKLVHPMNALDGTSFTPWRMLVPVNFTQLAKQLLPSDFIPAGNSGNYILGVRLSSRIGVKLLSVGSKQHAILGKEKIAAPAHCDLGKTLAFHEDRRFNQFN